jgi:hypothetical protein
VGERGRTLIRGPAEALREIAERVDALLGYGDRSERWHVVERN